MAFFSLSPILIKVCIIFFEAQNTKFKGNSALWAGQMRSRASEVGGHGPVEEGVLTQEDGSPVKLPPSSQALNCRRAGYHLAELMFLKDKRMKGSPPCDSGISGTQMGFFLGNTLCALEGPLEKAPKLLQGDTSLAKTCNLGFSTLCKKEVASVLNACSGSEPLSPLAAQLTFQFCGAPLTP